MRKAKHKGFRVHRKGHKRNLDARVARHGHSGKLNRPACSPAYVFQLVGSNILDSHQATHFVG